MYNDEIRRIILCKYDNNSTHASVKKRAMKDDATDVRHAGRTLAARRMSSSEWNELTI